MLKAWYFTKNKLCHRCVDKYFARIVDVFKLTLLRTFVKSTIMDVWRALITPLNCSNASNWLNVSQSMNRESSFDTIRYENIKTFTYVVVHDSIKYSVYNFLIALHIRLKTCRSNVLLGKMCAPEKLSASERFCNRESDSSTPFAQAC